MTKNQLKKISNLKGLKTKQFKEMNFVKNTIILRKNESTKYVYLLKVGEAGIFSDNDSSQPLHTYRQGDYLNSVEVCMSVNSFKTIRAITKCEILLIAWTKQRQDEEKKNIFIPKIQEMKFYQVSIFKNLSYGVMIQLLHHFYKQTVSKYQLNEFLTNKKKSTCFIITGTLTIQGLSRTTHINGLKRSDSCHSRFSVKSTVPEKSMKLLRFQKGEMLYLDHQNRFKYTCESQKCQIISINTDLLSYFLTSQSNQKIKELKQAQKENLINCQTNTQKALNLIDKSINRHVSKSQIVPIKFLNQIQRKCQNFQRAKSLHYKKNNRNFRSFSEEKRKIIQLRDKGYKELIQLNRRKYGRDYIHEKRLQISKNINGDIASSLVTEILQKSQSGNLPKSRATVYQSVNLKDDFAILKKSSLIKFIRRNKIDSKKQFISHNVSPVKPKKNQTQIQNLTLKSVSRIRKNFEDDSKTLLKNHKRKQMVMEF